MKKPTILLAALLLAAPATFAHAANTPVAVSAQKPVVYSDIQGHFAERAIAQFTRMNMIDKSGTGQFAPQSAINRAQFKTWLKTFTGFEVKDDLKTGTVSRLEAATWITQALDELGVKTSGQHVISFKDTGSLSAGERAVLNMASDLQVMVGSNGLFRPQESLNRGEAVAVLDRVFSIEMLWSKVVTPEALDKDHLPETAYTMLQENKMQSGLYSVVEGDSRYILWVADEMPGSQHVAQIDSIYETSNGLYLRTSVKSDAPNGNGGVVDPSLNRPYALVKVKASEKPLYLMNTDLQQPDSGPVLEPGQKMTYSQQTDVLVRDGLETVAIVASDVDGNGFAKSGFLGIYGVEGTLLQKLALGSDAINFPVGVAVEDLTGDGRPDIAVDSDLRGNGGRGVHAVNVFVQQNGSFAPSQVLDLQGDGMFDMSYDAAGKKWTLKEKASTNAWTAELSGDEWKNFDPSWMQKPYHLAIDPAYEMKVENHTLTTKHWCWVGSHVNGIAVLVADYAYQDGKFVVKNYHLEAPRDSIKIAKQ
jgi:hypothetical protein